MFFSYSKNENKIKKPFRKMIQNGFIYELFLIYFMIAEHAILAPEFPAGCDTKSSAP